MSCCEDWARDAAIPRTQVPALAPAANTNPLCRIEVVASHTVDRIEELEVIYL